MSGGSQPISSSRPTTIEQVGRVQLQDEARLGLDEVRVLVAVGDGLDLDLVAADLAGEGGQVLGGGDDVDGRGARRSGRETAQRGDGERTAMRVFMNDLLDQNGWAPWAPMENRNWNRNSLAVGPRRKCVWRYWPRIWLNSLGQ